MRSVGEQARHLRTYWGKVCSVHIADFISLIRQTGNPGNASCISRMRQAMVHREGKMETVLLLTHKA